MELLWNLGCIFQDTSVIRAEASDAGQRRQEEAHMLGNERGRTGQ